MLRPVGNLPSAVYWRRRLVVGAGALLVLLLLVLSVKSLGSSGGAAAASDASHSTSGSSVAPPPSGTAASGTGSSVPAANLSVQTASPSSSSARASAGPSPSSGHASPSGASPSPAAPQPCKAANLRLAALVDRSSYRVGDQPVVMLEVTDTASAACVQDFGDGKVELQVYNGESRVWGSNDCSAASGPLVTTLSPNRAVRVSVTWSGLSSTPGCKGTRQRVGAGTYTLYASLDGHPGAATQFALA